MRVLDLNPNSGEALVLSGSSIDLVRNVVAPFNGVVGVGHAPQFELNGWLPNVNSLTLSGPTTHTDRALQFLIDEESSLYDDVFSCTASTWAEWTVFVVGQLDLVPTVECTIFDVSQQLPASWPGSSPVRQANVLLYASATDFGLAVYADSSGPSNGIVLGSVDTGAHIFEATADGLGGFDGGLDGVLNGSTDVRPKTCGAMTLGSSFFACFPVEQMNGKFARVLIFDTKLSTNERNKVRNQLAALYGITL